MREQWLRQYKNTVSERDYRILDKASRILIQNIAPNKEGVLWNPYRAITPSMTEKPNKPGRVYFGGIWNWDSAFHMIGVSRFDKKLAHEQMEAFFLFQKENGLLPDVITLPEYGNKIMDQYSKPPVWAWATEQLDKRQPDIEFLKKMYPKLVKNESFWRTERYNSEDGLFFYSTTEQGENRDLYIRWESGLDDSIRFDGGNIEYLYPIDLNCFMVMFYRSMASIASVLQKETESLIWRSKAEALSVLINQKLWDAENHWYADANRYTGKVSSVLTPASFMPLYIAIASDAQAQSMRDIAVERFDSKMPTVSFDNPSYSNDYWRGPTWLNVAYFAAKGLKHYGFSVAEDIKDSILNMCFADTRGIFENYDSKTGKGLCCNHFSWSAVFILEFILNF